LAVWEGRSPLLREVIDGIRFAEGTRQTT